MVHLGVEAGQRRDHQATPMIEVLTDRSMPVAPRSRVIASSMTT